MTNLKSQSEAIKSPWLPKTETLVTGWQQNPAEAIFERLAFNVPCVPVAQPRQRHRVVGKFVQNFTPVKHPVNAFKAACQSAADSVYRGAPWDGPIRMDLVFVFPRPKRLLWKSRQMPRVWHTAKPDRDNCMKSLMDSLEGRIFRNDSQVCAGDVQKWIASGDEQPHVEVLFERLK